MKRVNKMLMLVKPFEFGNLFFDAIKSFALGTVLMLFSAVNLVPDLQSESNSERHIVIAFQFTFLLFVPDIRQIQSPFESLGLFAVRCKPLLKR